MDTAQEVLVALTARYSFAEVAALVADGAAGELTTRDVAQVQQLCALGQRLLDLDAEDFGETDAAADSNIEHTVADRITGDRVPEHLRERALACRMPQTAGERHRGALGSLRPAYELLLEVIDARFQRRETVSVVAAMHIASEYAPLLAWEQVLGHAADPIKMPVAVGGSGSSWGDFDDRDCPHTRTEKSAAKRTLTVARENAAGWGTYLDRQHSNTAHALAVCAVECKRPCSVINRLSAADADLVARASSLAIALNDSAVIKLRHSAPVGHGFGVPSRNELLETWARSRDSLARLEPSIAEDDGYPLPGFTALLSAVAGVRLTPSTLIADTAKALDAALAARQ